MKHTVAIVMLAFSTSIWGADAAQDEADIQTLLNAYFRAAQELYPSGVEPKHSLNQSLIAARSRTASYWRLRARDLETPSMRSALYFHTYRPKSWSIDNVRQAGDFARATVVVDVGSPLQLRLKGGPFKRRAQYSLVRAAGKWYIVGFKDLDQKQGQQRVAEQQQAALPDDLTPDAVVDVYLQRLQTIYTSASTMPDPVRVLDRTRDLWQLDERDARKDIARSNGFLVMIQPKSWSVRDSEISGDSARVRVRFAAATTQLGNVSLAKKDGEAVYTLGRHDGRWLITGLTPQP